MANFDASETSKVEPKFGVLLFPGFELLDVFGPLEMFAHSNATSPVTLIAEHSGAVASAQGPEVIAQYSFAKCPPLQGLLVPGGIGTRQQVHNTRLLEFIAARAREVKVLASVCTGAALLAKASALDGRRATTNKWSFGWVTQQGPSVEWVKHARWVEDGAVFTSSGVSAGMDMALAIIARLNGVEAAEIIAAHAEYDWHRDADWDPFAKAAGLVD
jgi:transcriptional regulator GlxA family with amidase domain